ncbi:MAG: ribulose-phosphate 3-epimerase [Candidatus Omnitrophota bacterium]|nr:MAG: ribulose-phosphate 3-epimerase [Candidatus Omnitrophota bacterium]
MIIPALLTAKRDELIQMLSVCREFTDYVQIDIMDGKFVPSMSLGLQDLEAISPLIQSEAHLMVEEPGDWLDAFAKFGSRRIIFHVEIENDHKEIIKRIRARNLEVGIAINPPTQLSDFVDLCELVDVVLFMTVNPGFYGSAFVPQVLEKIKEFKRLFPRKTVGIDGGVKLANIQQIAESGVDYICVGSAIFKAPRPKEAYLKFLKLFKKK